MQIRATRWVGLSLIAASLVFGAGCNGDDDATGVGHSCGTFHACGGDVIGTWSLQDVCYDKEPGQVAVEMFGQACADEVQDYAFHGTLTLSFEAGGSFHGEAGTFSLSESLRFTQQCLDAIAKSAGADQAVTVAQFCPRVEADYQQGGLDATCNVLAGHCDCDLHVSTDSTGDNEDGQYTVNGSTLSFPMSSSLLMGMDLSMGMGATDTDAGSASSEAPFCVRGSSLSISLVAAEGVNATMVFARR